MDIETSPQPGASVNSVNSIFGLGGQLHLTNPQRSASIGQLVKALAEANLDFKPVFLSSHNPYYGSKYANLPTLIEATKPALSKNGLVVFQTEQTTDKTVTVTTLLAHTSGEWIENGLTVPSFRAAKDGKIVYDIQGIGSATAYARRYSYQSLLNVAGEEEDDGNSSSEPNYQPREATKNRRNSVRVSDIEKTVEKLVPLKTESEPEKPVQITDDDLPDFGPNHEPVKTDNRLPTKEELQGHIQKVKGYKVSRENLEKFILTTAGVKNSKEISQAKWVSILRKLDDAVDFGQDDLNKLVGA